MASNKYKKRRIGFVILLLLLLLIAVGVITVTGEINGGKKTGETVTVTIEQGSGTSAIAQELKDAGLIGNTTLFKLYSRTMVGMETTSTATSRWKRAAAIRSSSMPSAPLSATGKR